MLKSYIIFINKPQVLKGAFKQLQNPHQHVTSSVFNMRRNGKRTPVTAHGSASEVSSSQ